MNETIALDISRQAMQVGLMVSLPILAVALFVGILVSIFQSLTQIQEATLTFVPKLVAVGIAVALLGHWMLTTITTFTVRCFEQAAHVSQPTNF
jgi:flagellar biosynthetic protein FliQ